MIFFVKVITGEIGDFNDTFLFDSEFQMWYSRHR